MINMINHMKISDILPETSPYALTTKDEYGGFIKFEPNPKIILSPTKFSIAYINVEIASFYNVDNRLLGYDSHSHKGILEPHIHAFSKLKNKKKVYLDLNKNIIDVASYRQNIEIFYGPYIALIKTYLRDLCNAKK